MSEAANERINEHLAKENERLQRELSEVRAMLGRPVNVNVTGPEGATLTKIGEYLPQLTHLSTNTAEVGGKLANMVSHQITTNVKFDTMIHTLDRIADSLDRLIPEPPEGGPEADDRHFHMEAGAPWDGRLCKKYGLTWSVVDPGDLDPLSAGDQCTAKHAVWKEEA